MRLKPLLAQFLNIMIYTLPFINWRKTTRAAAKILYVPRSSGLEGTLVFLFHPKLVIACSHQPEISTIRIF